MKQQQQQQTNNLHSDFSLLNRTLANYPITATLSPLIILFQSVNFHQNIFFPPTQQQRQSASVYNLHYNGHPPQFIITGTDQKVCLFSFHHSFSFSFSHHHHLSFCQAPSTYSY